MSLRENIRKYSKEKGIPVYKLEEEIGISNGCNAYCHGSRRIQCKGSV